MWWDLIGQKACFSCMLLGHNYKIWAQTTEIQTLVMKIFTKVWYRGWLLLDHQTQSSYRLNSARFFYSGIVLGLYQLYFHHKLPLPCTKAKENPCPGELSLNRWDGWRCEMIHPVSLQKQKVSLRWRSRSSRQTPGIWLPLSSVGSSLHWCSPSGIVLFIFFHFSRIPNVLRI